MISNKDFLFAIWVFKTLGWSNRRIAKLLSTSHPTINQLVSRAYAFGSTFKLSSFAKGEGGVRIKQRAIFVLHMAGFTEREIAKLLNGASKGSVNRAKSRGYGEYGD